MSPRIRTIGTYATQQKFSVDFFGEELIVTVTPDPSVIGQWIHDVLNYNRFSSHPLVVGVGVQWTPAGYYSDSPPVRHRFDSPPLSYRSDSPPVSHRSDSAPVSCRSDSPPVSSRSDSPPVSYRSDSPPVSSRSESPPVRYRSYSPPVQYRSDSPVVSHRSDPPADTLQLCVGNRCIIIQLSRCDRVPQVLRRFLADPDCRFVGFWNSQDVGKLERSRHQLAIAELLDLTNFVVDSRGRSLRGRSFEVVVEECMGYRGVRLEREVCMSDWRVYDLSYDQILQASIDVYVCFNLSVRYRL